MSVAPSRHEWVFHPAVLRSLCVHIRRRGVSLADALAGTGMTWQKLLREKRSVAFDPMRTLVLNAQQLTGCPWLGLEWGVSVEAATQGLTGAAIVVSRDVSQALETAARYHPLRSRSVEYQLAVREDRSTLIMREVLDLRDIRTFILEANAAIVERFLTTVAGEPLVEIEYRFPYAPPAWAPEYSRLLAGKVHFGAAQLELRVPRKILRLPGVVALASDRSGLALLAERELALLRSSGDLSRQIRLRLFEKQGPYPSVQAMAQQLNMSPRTLHRKLRQEGTTYQTLLDDARRELAEWYLLMTREPIEAIAERLGYADASSFSRTFRRWFATAPGRFRDDRRDTQDMIPER